MCDNSFSTGGEFKVILKSPLSKWNDTPLKKKKSVNLCTSKKLLI